MSQQINLFNPIFLRKKKYFSAVTMVQAIGAILVGCVGLGVYANYQVSRLAKEAQSTTAQMGVIQAQLDKVKAEYGDRQVGKSLEQQLLRAEADVSTLKLVSDVLQDSSFDHAKGYAEYMRAFSRQIINGVWLTGFDIGGEGGAIELQGRALKPDLVPAYISRLKNESALRGKSFTALEMRSVSAAKAEAGNKDAGSTVETAPYIEFNLQSSDGGKSAAERAGTKTK